MEYTRRLHEPEVAPDHVGEVLRFVYQALLEKGYNPVDQLVGYLLSGDPAYITAHQGARSVVGGLERHELLEQLVRSYLSSADGRADRGH